MWMGGRETEGWQEGGERQSGRELCKAEGVPGLPTKIAPRDSARTVSLGTMRVPVLKLPAGNRTVPQCSIAALSAAVSDATPSPTAPKARTLQVLPTRGTAGSRAGPRAAERAPGVSGAPNRAAVKVSNNSGPPTPTIIVQWWRAGSFLVGLSSLAR